MSPSVAFLVIGLAVDARDILDPEMLDRLIHGDLRGRSNAEGMEIVHILEKALKEHRASGLTTDKHSVSMEVLSIDKPNGGRDG